MVTVEAAHPWDDTAMVNDLLALLPSLDRRRLDRIEPPSQPGAYLQFFATERAAPLGELASSARICAYVGAASRSLRERIGRYRQSIAGIGAIDEKDMYLALIPCASAASARFCEEVLIEHLQPVLNGTGWGSKVPGANRTKQACCYADCLLPGRRWASAASPLDQAQAQLHVLRRLTTLDPGTPRWPALQPAE